MDFFFFFALKTLTFALPMFPGGGHQWLFPVEDGHHTGVDSVGGSCVL